MLARPSLLGSLALLATLHYAAAQVTTSCQPLNTTNCPPDPAFGMDYNFIFNQTPPSNTWDNTVGTVNYDPTNGASFTVAQEGDSPTIRTAFYFFFGRVEMWIKAAPGQGIVTSTMMLSDDLDEIDLEFIGGNNSFAETNFFSKGAQVYTNSEWCPVSGVQDDYHNYTTVWTKDSLVYWMDGQVVRTIPNDPNNATSAFPQTPMRLSIGIWAGGDPKNQPGVIAWAGGQTDYTKGPYTMYVKSVRITDYSNGASQYTYGDQSGSWNSIRVTTGNSTAEQSINAPPPLTLAERWNNLSPTAKIAIYASAASVGGAFVIWAVFYCIRQRRRGAREARIAEQRAEEERLELERFKRAGVDPDSFAVEGAEYDPNELRRDGMTHGDSYSVLDSPAAATPQEKAWEAAAVRNSPPGALPAAGTRSPAVPLLPTSPGPASVRSGGMGMGASSPRGAYANLNNAPVSPLQPPSPSNGSAQRYAPPQAGRSFTSPAAQMRVASPGPANGMYGNDISRMHSPAPMPAQPAPQRSYTTGGYGPPPPRPDRGYGQSGGYGGGYGGGGGGGDQQYWGNGGWR